jgi:hypothetical protein
MKNYLDLLDTDVHLLDICLKLKAITNNGIPLISVTINDDICFRGYLDNTITVYKRIALLDTLSVQITLENKNYSDTAETAVVIDSLTIDNIDMVPTCIDCICYANDQNQNTQAFYLGFNGVWQFKLNEPFYRWWHQQSGQGWLLEPAPMQN